MYRVFQIEGIKYRKHEIPIPRSEYSDRGFLKLRQGIWEYSGVVPEFFFFIGVYRMTKKSDTDRFVVIIHLKYSKKKRGSVDYQVKLSDVIPGPVFISGGRWHRRRYTPLVLPKEKSEFEKLFRYPSDSESESETTDSDSESEKAESASASDRETVESYFSSDSDEPPSREVWSVFPDYSGRAKSASGKLADGFGKPVFVFDDDFDFRRVSNNETYEYFDFVS